MSQSFFNNSLPDGNRNYVGLGLNESQFNNQSCFNDDLMYGYTIQGSEEQGFMYYPEVHDNSYFNNSDKIKDVAKSFKEIKNEDANTYNNQGNIAETNKSMLNKKREQTDKALSDFKNNSSTNALTTRDKRNKNMKIKRAEQKKTLLSPDQFE